jgi:hypothetical protein
MMVMVVIDHAPAEGENPVKSTDVRRCGNIGIN